MNLVKSASRDESRPEVVTLKFPDWVSQGDRNASPSPRNTWKALAEKKGAELGVPVEVRRTDEGLSAAFLNGADADRILGAMSSEWHTRLIDSLRSQVGYAQLAARMMASGDLGEPASKSESLSWYRDGIDRLARDYDVDPQELVDFNGRPALDGFE